MSDTGAKVEIKLAVDCLKSIADMKEDEPREQDDADWRFRALECKRSAAATLLAIAALRSPAAPEGPKEVTVTELSRWLVDNISLDADNVGEARALLAKYTITPKVQS